MSSSVLIVVDFFMFLSRGAHDTVLVLTSRGYEMKRERRSGWEWDAWASLRTAACEEKRIKGFISWKSEFPFLSPNTHISLSPSLPLAPLLLLLSFPSHFKSSVIKALWQAHSEPPSEAVVVASFTCYRALEADWMEMVVLVMVV